MNKKIKEFLTNKGLTITGTTAFGLIDNYEVNFAVNSAQFSQPVAFHISFFAINEIKSEIWKQFNELNIKGIGFSFTPYGMLFTFTGMTFGSIAKNINDNFDKIIEVINQYEVKKTPYCPICGSEITQENSKTCTIQGFRITLDQDCVNKINHEIQADNAAFEELPNNYGKGFVGILIGSIAGVVIAFILFMIGFISAISAVAGIWLGSYLYQKFGGKPNAVMVIMSSLTTLVFLLLFVFIIYVYVANVADINVTSTGFAAFTEAMRNVPEFKTEFISNLLMTVLFSAIGAGYEAYSLFRKVKRNKSID